MSDTITEGLAGLKARAKDLRPPMVEWVDLCIVLRGNRTACSRG